MFNAKISVYNFATKGSGYVDMNNVDTDVQLTTGCMRVVFLNKFISNLLVGVISKPYMHVYIESIMVIF